MKEKQKRLAIHEITTTQGDVISKIVNIEAKAACFFEKQFLETENIKEEHMVDVIPKLITSE